MDSSTEAKLINDLKSEIEDKTLVLITHKNSMLQLVDRIIVVDQGNILIDGPKEVVLNQLMGKKMKSKFSLKPIIKTKQYSFFEK